MVPCHRITRPMFITEHIPITWLMQMKSTCQRDPGLVSLLLMTVHMSRVVDFNSKLFLVGFHATLLQCSTSTYWLIGIIYSQCWCGITINAYHWMEENGKCLMCVSFTPNGQYHSTYHVCLLPSFLFSGIHFCIMLWKTDVLGKECGIEGKGSHHNRDWVSLVALPNCSYCFLLLQR